MFQNGFDRKDAIFVSTTFYFICIFFMFNLRLCTARPLDIPLEDRMVSNVTFEGPMTAQQDYRLTDCDVETSSVSTYYTVHVPREMVERGQL